MRLRIVLTATLLTLIAGAASGCYGAGYAVHLAMSGVQQGLNLGTQISGMIEHADVKAVVTPGVTKDELGRIKRLALAFTTSWPNGETIDAGMSDAVTGELLGLGYQMIDRSIIVGAAAKAGIIHTGGVTPEFIREAAQQYGFDALVFGSVTRNQDIRTSPSNVKFGGMVQTASVRIVSPTRGDVLAVVNVSYRRGKNPVEAAADIAKLLRANLNGETLTAQRTP